MRGKSRVSRILALMARIHLYANIHIMYHLWLAKFRVSVISALCNSNYMKLMMHVCMTTNIDFLLFNNISL